MSKEKSKSITEQIDIRQDAIPYDRITAEQIEKYLNDIIDSTPTNKRVKYDTSIKVWQDDKHLSFQMGGILRTGIGGFISYVSNCGDFIKLSPIIFNGVRLDKDGREWFWKEFEKIKALYEINN